MQKAVVMVQELEHASIGVNLMDASRVINAPMPMSGTISTTKRRDVGSVPVWNTLPKTARLVTRLWQVQVIEAPKEAPKARERQRMARTTRAKARTGTSRSGEWISLQRIHSLKLPRYNSNLKLLRYNSNLKLPRYNSNLKLLRHNSNLKLLRYKSSLKLLKYNNKFSPQSWVKLPVFWRQCEQRQRLQGCWRWWLTAIRVCFWTQGPRISLEDPMMRLSGCRRSQQRYKQRQEKHSWGCRRWADLCWQRMICSQLYLWECWLSMDVRWGGIAMGVLSHMPSWVKWKSQFVTIVPTWPMMWGWSSFESWKLLRRTSSWRCEVWKSQVGSRMTRTWPTSSRSCFLKHLWSCCNLWWAKLVMRLDCHGIAINGDASRRPRALCWICFQVQIKRGGQKDCHTTSKWWMWIYFEDKIFWTQQFGTFYCSLWGRVEWLQYSLAHRAEQYQLHVTGLMEDRGLWGRDMVYRGLAWIPTRWWSNSWQTLTASFGWEHCSWCMRPSSTTLKSRP